MKIVKLIIIIIIILFFHFSCTLIKMGSLFLGGELKRVNFREEIDFDYRGRLIFADVKINQSTKYFKFVLDTGAALSVVSEQIADEFGIKATVSDQISDATKKKETIRFGKIPLITIGHIPFQNIGTAIMNVDKTSNFKCYRIDGVIGANLMRLVPIWRINYEERKIVFTDILSSKMTTPSDFAVPFRKSMQKIPEIQLKINNQLTIRGEVDLGSTHGIISSLKDWSEIRKSVPDLIYVKGYGEGSQGALGASTGFHYIVKLKNMSIGNLFLESALMAFYPNVPSSFGNAFFENYIVTIDWKKQVIHLSPISAISKSTKFESFGFSYSYNMETKQLYVNIIYENSPADKQGLKFGDQIQSINGRKLIDLTLAEYCELFFQSNVLMGLDPLKIVVKRGDQEHQISIKKAVLID